MKCKLCGGTGTSNTCVNGTFKPCSFCDGTGEYEPFDADVELDKLYPTEQTNEEWFCQLSTEEKAKVFANATYSTAETPLTILWGGKEAEQKKWELWLKEKHNG